MVHFPFNESPEKEWQNLESVSTPLVSPHSANDHAEDSSLIICPPATYFDGSKCVLSNIYIYIYNLDIYSNYVPSYYENYGGSLGNQKTGIGMVTIGLWVYKHSMRSGLDRMMWTDSEVYALYGSTTQLRFHIIKESSTPTFTANIPMYTWTYCGMSWGNYVNTNFVIGKQKYTDTADNTMMTTTSTTGFYFGHNSIRFYMKELFLLGDYKGISELEELEYYTYSFDHKYMNIYHDMSNYGFTSKSGNTKDQHLRCPLNTKLDMGDDQLYCIQAATLNIHKSLILNTTWMDLQLLATIEFSFKLLLWGNTDMLLFSIGDALRVQIDVNTKLITVIGIDYLGAIKFNVTPTFLLNLHVQYHFAITYDHIHLNLYLNRVNQLFIIVTTLSIYLFLI